MGIFQVGFVVVFAIGSFVAEWGVNAADDWIPNKFRIQRDVVQIPTFVPSVPAFVPSKFPPQFTVQTPVKTEYRGPVQDLLDVQTKELLQGPVPSISWTFPGVKPKPQQPDIPFELRHPLPANSVAAQCGERLIRVEVLEDFFGTGMLMMPTAFSLGGCAPIGEDPTAKVVIFESELHKCGSTTVMTENELVYTFNLIFTPQDAPAGAPIARSSGAVVGIQCHYPRLINVTSNALLPTWLPYGATMVAEELLVFSLRIMTEDWLYERPSNEFFLGDFINLEASVMSYNHIPLRVFVDSCVASSDPTVANALRYSFIENNGCLVDSKLTGSSSKFMARTQMDKLHFQLEAFRFQQDLTGVIYIACVLEVAAASVPTNVEQKACSYSSSNGWLSADDDHLVCGCCDSTCGEQTEQLNVAPKWDAAFVGPISIKEFAYGPM
ncbi:zona pellucida glycoprotein 3e precursor [Danio rerio]|uniref:Zona pellucida sperm-binding protein 3 n=1 Tax=Danio rerio TaxID=7955 RepID=A7MBZ6_DANRE|nr:zona pellucida glycoprotein 3e precursor [Danio rerio]AAI51979.1 Zgc:171779 protein [Danio rerio]|eukprot:NP_001103303.1 zona pellucida glycoprotein 3-like precursor [Danio rerio]